MNRQIRTITEKKRFESIINKYFASSSLFYKSKSGNIEVQYLGNENGMAEIKFPNSIGIPDECVLFTSKDETTVISYMAKKGQKSDEIALYNPSSFQIVYSSRSEKRYNLQTDEKTVLYARNMISESHLIDAFNIHDKKINQLKNLLLQNGVDTQHRIKINFLHEIVDESRIIFFRKFKRALFIPSRYNDKNDAKNADLKYYLDSIFETDDYFKKNPKIISEISVPIMYKNKIIIGYIQVNSDSLLSLSALQNYKRMALVIENKIVESKIIEDSEREFLISNISSTGVCIVFKENGTIEKFQKNSLVYFEIMLPFRQKVELNTEVRHIIDLPNNVKKIGFKIIDIDKQGNDFFKNYIDKLNP
jgi:hypothetical protein